MAGRRGQYPPELCERAVRLVIESRPDHGSEWEAMHSVATKFGIGTTETVRKWVRRADVDAGARPGVTSEDAADVRRLRAEVRELRRANEILKAAAGSSRPSSIGHTRSREVRCDSCRAAHGRRAALGGSSRSAACCASTGRRSPPASTTTPLAGHRRSGPSMTSS